MRTWEFSAIFGVVPGYGHDNEVREDPVDRLARAWHDAALAERGRSDLYVTAALAERRVLYPREQGAPAEGEVSVEATGACNPRCEDPSVWREAVQHVVADVRSKLRQCTVRIVFRRVDDVLFEAQAR